ncbi:type IV pilus modification PilV family protein [Veronia pacifica]|uniref:Prepilin-type N-terminal cleavage/methylation domain-containing protein n=1 Tax=Veronia pacifica TaxID=1080227 RepID=A0A1C3E762_9GAMM|nr:prepilin-type N-terminal cleavage/methylation domain-containing protein [Veronia pacifica]ODA29063.1 hypothetical protein A8L45_22710 [Veronia pacifica]
MTSNRGFSFIEILIALVVVTISGVGSMKLYSYIEQLKGDAIHTLRAQQVAQQQVSLLQTINTQGQNCTSDEGGEDITLDNVENCSISLEQSSPFEIETSVENILSDTDGTFGKLLQVKVTWDDRAGNQQSVTMLTMVSKFSNLIT